MPKIPGVNHRNVVRALQKAGFRIVRESKHIVMSDGVRILTILLRDRLNATLQEIRTTRQIKTPMMWCPKCNARHRAAQPTISVRAMILTLGRFSVTNEPAVKKLEKDWAKYRKEHRLDLYGKPENSVLEMTDRG